MTALLFCHGEIFNYENCKRYLNKYGIVICCDGGLRHAHNLQITPSYIIGDMDSVDCALLQQYRQNKVKIIEHPKEKETTDSALGLDLAIRLGATEVVIMGGIGSRFDHSVANMFLLLTALQKNVTAVLVGENNIVYLIDSSITLASAEGTTVSLIPLTPHVHGITTEGLKYPLCNETLSLGSTRGISNVMLDKNARVKIQQGLLAIVLEQHTDAH